MNLTIYLVEEGPAMELSVVLEDSHWGPEAREDGQEVAVEGKQPVIHPGSLLCLLLSNTKGATENTDKKNLES